MVAPYYSGETGWPSLFGLRVKLDRTNLAHIFSGQLLTSLARPDAGYGLKWAKIKKKITKTCNLSNFIIIQIKKIKHKCLIIVNQ